MPVHDWQSAFGSERGVLRHILNAAVDFLAIWRASSIVVPWVSNMTLLVEGEIVQIMSLAMVLDFLNEMIEGRM